MTNLSIFLFITFLPSLVLAQARPMILRHVTLIDMRSERPKPDMSVMISGGRIVKIGRNIKVPGAAEIVDASGKFLIPGLWDSYTFTLEAVKHGQPFFELLLAHGVTGVRDVGTSMNLSDVANLRADINAGHVLAPRLFYAGAVLQSEVPPRRSNRWSGFSTVVKTVEEARTAVEEQSRAGVDHIKVEKRTRPEVLKEIIRTAHEHNLRVVGVPPAFVLDASNDGLDCIEHFAEFFRETSDKRTEYYALYRDHKIDSMTTDENYAFFGTMETDEPYYRETIKALVRNGTYVVTNTAQTSTFIGDFELTDLSRRRFKTKEQVAETEAAVLERARQIRNNDYRMSDKNRRRHLRELLDLHRAGVRMLAGTQSAYDSIGTAGLTLHDELALFVMAGLSPFESLKTATVNPAVFIRRNDLGTIEEGKLADIVLLDANPLVDISNTRKINAVVAGGKYLSRKDLDRMLSSIEEKAKMGH